MYEAKKVISPQMNNLPTFRSALFLDRDGVINVDHGYVYRQEDFHFIPGIFEICRQARDKGFAIVIITNQAGIGRGYYKPADFEQLTNWMLSCFLAEGIHISAVYHCPDHPEASINDYRRDSFYRKPNPGMIFRARDDLALNLANSILIGDKETDIEAAKRAGVGMSIRFATLKQDETTHAHFTTHDFYTVSRILSQVNSGATFPSLSMPPQKIYVAGHTGLAGSALVKVLQTEHKANLVVRTHAELDLRDAAAVDRFFMVERPDCVFLSAARVGGILANSHFPVEFLLDNLAIEINVITSCHRYDVRRLIVFGSNCAYPRDAAQPIPESALLTGPLEPTNSAFATAKIAAIELCRAYNQQYGRHYLVVMPTGLYGPGDNYDPRNSHVTAAMIRRFHEAKQAGLPGVDIWGTGSPLRELLYHEDCARAGTHLAFLAEDKFEALLQAGFYPLLNIGGGEEVSILELARRVAAVVGYTGTIATDPTKPDGMPRKLLDGSRLAALGWCPQVPLAEGLQRAYADFLARHT